MGHISKTSDVSVSQRAFCTQKCFEHKYSSQCLGAGPASMNHNPKTRCRFCRPTFADQGSESQGLSKTPIHALTGLYSLAAPVKDPLDTLVGVEPLWQAADGHANL